MDNAGMFADEHVTSEDGVQVTIATIYLAVAAAMATRLVRIIWVGVTWFHEEPSEASPSYIWFMSKLFRSGWDELSLTGLDKLPFTIRLSDF